MIDQVHETTAYVGLGSNLGDRLAALRAAVDSLAAWSDVSVDFKTGVASLYETTPVGCPVGQPDFLNSAVRVRTTLPAAELLDVLLTIEASLGRTRSGADLSKQSEPRVIDLDLLLFAELAVTTDKLVVPHPRFHERLFVLEPLAEIAGGVLHPVFGESIATMADRRRDQSDGQKVARLRGPDWCRDALKVR